MADPPRPARRALTAVRALVQRARWCLLWTASLTGTCWARPAHDEVGDPATDPDEWVPALLGLVLVPLLIFALRRLLVGYVNQQMMTKSVDQPAVEIEELRAPEEDARAPPGFVVHEADLLAGGGSSPREQGVLQMFRRVCMTDMGIALAYAGLPFVCGLLEDNDMANAGLWAGLVVAGFRFARYLLHRRQFRAYDLRRTRTRQGIYRWLARIGYGFLVLITLGTGATAVNLVYVPEILRGVFGSRVRMLLSVVVVAGCAGFALTVIADSSVSTTRTAAAGLLAAALLHAGILVVHTRRMRQVRGPSLLVLRVFDIDATSSFTFSGLMDYWRHFGNHFTVADRSLLRQGYSNRSWSTVLLAFAWWGALLVATIVLVESLQDRLDTHLDWPWRCALVALLALLPACLWWVIGKHRIDARFVRNHEQLLTRLRGIEKQPRRFDLSFKHIHALCHDDTWFPAVAEFARRARVVLVDLRGYSEARKGCQREVDFLFDAIPAERILFLVDTADDEALVEEMLLGRWEQLRATSPNLANDAPVLHLYLARDNDKRDMQGILDCLMRIVDGPLPAPA